MALAVTGGQGNVTNTITNTDAIANTVAVGEITVFTTPATSNAMFRVSLAVVINVTVAAPNVFVVIPVSKSGNQFSAFDASAGTETDGKVIGIVSGDVNDIAGVSGELYVGPSTAIKIPYTLINSSAAQSAFQYNVSYHYAASVIT